MESATLSFLDAFYKTDSGQILVSEAARLIETSMNVMGSNVLAVGFSGEYLDKLDNGKLYYAIPSSYPLVHWPKIRPFRTIIVDEAALPFFPNTWDVVVVIHLLEFRRAGSAFLKDVFRILKNDGKLVIISANKNSSVKKSLFATSKKNTAKIIKNDVNEIMRLLTDASFGITGVFGINKKLRFWPYNFSYNINRYNEALISVFPFLSDIVVMMAEKTELVAETVEALDAQYES
jgi:SAM-dependent methyltransferase